MKTNLLFITIFSLFLYSCSSTKKINESIQKGNYDYAFTESLEKIKRSKKLEKISQTIKDLETSFAKANERDLLLIEDFKKNKSDDRRGNRSVAYFLAIVTYPEWQTLVDGLVPRFDLVISLSINSWV